MPSNREWLNQIAADDPQKLNVWFEAEHVDDNDEISKLIAERDEWKAKAESALHENPYVGLVRGKQWKRTEISDYYCGRCWWKVTDHDSYCPECGGALHHKASNKPDSQSDAPKSEETAENATSKRGIRDFADSREKLEADVHARSEGGQRRKVLEWLDRQAEITAKRLCSDCTPNVAEERDYLRTRVDELNTQVQEQSELIAARGKTIEALEKFMSERKYKLKKQLESKTEQCRKLKAERDEYRELYEAAMSTDYGQLSKEHEQFREEISEMLDAAQQIERIAAKYEAQSN